MRNNKQYYFMYHGRRVEPGTILKIKPWCGVEEVIFEWYVPESDIYVLKYFNSRNVHGMTGVGMHGEEFRRLLISPTNKMDKWVVQSYQMRMENNKLTFIKELQVDGMLIAWLWYVVLMVVTLIFNGFYLYWAFISFCFFVYRYGKLKEEGYK